MTLIEFISFIITMLLVIFLSSRRAVQDRKRQLDPEYYEEGGEEDDNIKEMVRLLNLSPEDAQALERELKGEKSPPPPPPKAKQPRQTKKRVTRTLSDQYALHTNIEDFKQRSKVAEREFDTNIDHRYERPREPLATQSLRIAPEKDPYALSEKKAMNARILNILNSLDSKKDMILINEILDRPKALRDDTIHW